MFYTLDHCCIFLIYLFLYCVLFFFFFFFVFLFLFFFFFSSRRRHTRLTCDWSSDVCSSDLAQNPLEGRACFGRKRVGPPVRRRVARRILRDHPVAKSREIRERFRGRKFRSEERRVGKECRSRWTP